MKRMFLLLAAVTLSTALFAQSKMNDNKMKSDDHKMKMKNKMQDCVMMEDGKMMVMKGGETMAMTADENMANGTTVMTDGTVKMKNGKTMKLKEGQCVYKSGKVGMMKMDKMKDNKM